jgi:hypothetical protein
VTRYRCLSIPEHKVCKVPYTTCRMVPEERCEVVRCCRCRLVPEERVCKVPYTTCRMVSEECVRQVPVTTCHMEPYCVTYKVCRRIPVTIAVCPPPCPGSAEPPVLQSH